MKIYLVGGAVRDIIMSQTPNDRDFVVVGSTPEEMLKIGFNQVGADFPVFIHPKTGEEYALARTEKKVGGGHKGFETNFSPDVTLEEDLFRRDLSINAMAFDGPLGLDRYYTVIDPYGGKKDIKNKILRATSKAFAEDPLRVYRLARFSAKFPTFTIDPLTIQMCKDMIKGEEFVNLTPERIGIELMKALGEKQPSKFFWFLKEIDALQIHMKEVADLIGQTQPEKWHPEGDSFVHTMEVLDRATEGTSSEKLRFYALVHDFGKGITPKELLPHHYGHEGAGVPLVENFCNRLKLPNDFRKLGMKIAKYHMHVHKTDILNPKTFVKVFEAFRGNLNELEILSRVSKFDANGRGEESRKDPYPQATKFITNMAKISKVKLGDKYSTEELKNMKVGRIINELYRMRIQSIKENK